MVEFLTPNMNEFSIKQKLITQKIYQKRCRTSLWTFDQTNTWHELSCQLKSQSFYIMKGVLVLNIEDDVDAWNLPAMNIRQQTISHLANYSSTNLQTYYFIELDSCVSSRWEFFSIRADSYGTYSSCDELISAMFLKLFKDLLSDSL